MCVQSDPIFLVQAPGATSAGTSCAQQVIHASTPERLETRRNRALLIDARGAEQRAALRRAWGECLRECRSVRAAQKAAYASSDALCRKKG